MIHSVNDTIIPYESAEQTYAKALEPKELHTVECATHGYCAEMDALLEKELKRRVRDFTQRLFLKIPLSSFLS